MFIIAAADLSRDELEEVSAKIEKRMAKSYNKSTMSQTQKLAADLDKGNVVEPSMKKPKLVPEVCELFVNVDSQGACSFEVLSKIESSFDSSRLQLTETLNNLNNGLIVKDVAAGFNSSSTSLTDMKEMPFSNTVPSFTRPRDEKSNTDKLERVLGNDPDYEVAIPAISSYVALDCEFVGVRNDQSALGRCSIVDYHGNIVCDIYARPTDPITTYRTRWSGITRSHMSRAIPIESALSQISDIIQDKIVVGHAIHNDFRVLGLKHPWTRTRDTSRIPLLSNKLGKKEKPSLKVLAKVHLDQDIQNGSHCSVIDAQAAMELYKLVRVKWETSLLNNQPFGNKEDKDCGNFCEESASCERGDNIVSENPENGPKIVKMSESKVRKQNKQTNIYKLHFGQIVNPTKSVEDYFIDRKKSKSGMKHSQSCQLLPSMLSSEKFDLLATSKTNIKCSDENSNFQLPSCSSFNSDNQSQPSRKRLLQGDFATKDLKNTYQRTVKQLFQDEFWPEYQH